MSEARSEHEFSFAGVPYRVAWDRELSAWVADVSLRGEWRRLFPNLSHMPFAVEIARLRGLVPPGGEENP